MSFVNSFHETGFWVLQIQVTGNSGNPIKEHAQSVLVFPDSYKSLFLISVFVVEEKVDRVAELRRQIELKEVAHEGMVNASEVT